MFTLFIFTLFIIQKQKFYQNLNLNEKLKLFFESF